MSFFLEQVVVMRYQPAPGWATRWSDVDNNTDDPPGIPNVPDPTWDNVETEGTKWIDLYSGSAESNMYWLTDSALWISDQVIKKDSLKKYFVERVLIDLNELVGEFTTDRWIYADQILFHMQAELEGGFTGSNDFKISVGWADTLNDTPEYLPLESINLQTRQNNGTVQYDFRSTGRYLAIRLEFDATSAIKFTSAEINAVQTHGR